MISCCGLSSGMADAAPSIEQLGEKVADSGALPEGGRLQLKLMGRYITVLRLQGKVLCIDAVCFHAGGPLGIGDIEEVNGRACLVCPWHYYKIDIESGDKYYQKMSFQNGKMVEGDWVSNGVKQRTHKVTEQDGAIYVRLSTAPAVVESDEYARMASCGDRVMSSAARQRGPNVGGDGRLPSGSVLRSAREAAQASNPGSAWRSAGR
ncbi:Rieske [2Fe-2S] iron-sulfur domain-containing protein [Haematococcus lacustris]